MYILMIARGYPTEEDPQWGCFEQDQAEALCNNGHQVVVLSVDSRFLWKFRKVGITHYSKNGVNYYNSFWFPGVLTRTISRKFNVFIKKCQVDKLYKKVEFLYGRPDVVYGQFFFNTDIGVYLQKKYNLPLVGIEHAGRFNSDRLDSITKWMATNAYANADEIITVSQTLRKRILYHFKRDSYVIHNLVNNIFFDSVRKVERTNSFSFVSTGSLVYGKGFDLLIEAFSLINRRNKDIHLVIIGDGVERQNLQKQIDNLKLSHNIHLVGKKTKGEIVQILSDSSVFILPSRSENFSVSILEGLAVGLPVIATLCGGVKECINEKNGLLVPVENVPALADAMKKMYDTLGEYDSQEIAQDCYNRFSPSVISDKLVDVFQKAVEKKKKMS